MTGIARLSTAGCTVGNGWRSIFINDRDRDKPLERLPVVLNKIKSVSTVCKMWQKRWQEETNDDDDDTLFNELETGRRNGAVSY